MKQASDSPNSHARKPVDKEGVSDLGTTRRAFLRSSARKAAYITPVVLTMAASEVRAGSVWDSTCADNTSPCTVDGDCCGGLTCMTGTCQ